jgi:hypothetical protein
MTRVVNFLISYLSYLQLSESEKKGQKKNKATPKKSAANFTGI